jgi:hypothetical protein
MFDPSSEVNTHSADLVPRLLGQCSLGSPGFSPPPTTFLYLLWPALCYLLPWPCYPSLTLLLSSRLPMWPTIPTSLPVLIQLSVFDCWLSLLLPAHAGSSLVDILNMKAICSSETSVHTRFTWLHIPEDSILLSRITFNCNNMTR